MRQRIILRLRTARLDASWPAGTARWYHRGNLLSSSENTPFVRLVAKKAVREVPAIVNPRDGGYAVKVTAPKSGQRTLAFADSQIKRPAAIEIGCKLAFALVHVFAGT